MKMAEIQKKAQNLGLDPGKLKKLELIQSIQAREGNESCYKSKNDPCSQYDCCWRADCNPK